MTVAAKQRASQAGDQPPVKARELMEKLNADASKLNIWVRTEMNAPAQRSWFTDPGGDTGAGQLAGGGRVSANQIKALPTLWRWKDYRPFLDRINEIAARADVSPIEFADRQSILLTNPGLGGRLQVTSTMRCAISIYTPGDVAPAHIHSANASRTILSDKGGYTNVEGERCDAERGDIILTPNGTWHDHGNEAKQPVIWIDMLDWPLMEFLDCAWVDQDFEPGTGSNAKSQDAVHKNGYSGKLYGSGGMVPTFLSHQIGWGRDPAPLIHFRGERIRDTLAALRGAGQEREREIDMLRFQVHEIEAAALERPDMLADRHFAHQPAFMVDPQQHRSNFEQRIGCRVEAAGFDVHHDWQEAAKAVAHQDRLAVHDSPPVGSSLHAICSPANSGTSSPSPKR